MGNRYTGKTFIGEILAILLGLVFLVPFYYVISNSLKPFADILSNTSALPKVLEFQNYVSAFEKLNYLKVFTNSLIVTIASNVVLVIFCSMAAYMLVRTKNKISNVIFMIFVAAMIIPFQSIMIPLIKACGAW
jgi:raffinose/stachyose/melibiose transport system permease protein